MKIWITRSRAWSIQCGGLERLWVWFREPVWIEEWRTEKDDCNPFMQLSDLNGRRLGKWEVRGNGTTWITSCVSFGKLFGYGDGEYPEFANEVWDRLMKHFGDTPFRQINEYENQNPETCNVKNFLLEYDLKFDFSFIKQV